MKKVLTVLGVMSCLAVSSAWANSAPVVDLSNHTAVAANGAATPLPTNNVQQPISDANNNGGIGNIGVNQDMLTQTMSTEQRLARLEQQMNNLTRMNMPQQIADLQQQVQQLNGQLQVQAHDLKTLNNQLSSFYKDLDKRITEISNLSNNNSTAVSSGNNSGSSSSNTGTNNNSNNKPAPKTNTKNVAKPMVKQSANSVPSSTDAADASAYQSAFKMLANKDLPAAAKAFQSYMDDFPNGKYMANAHYWLGDIYMRQNNYTKAQNEFHTVITEFATSNKVADSTLKLGMLSQKQGNTAKAKTFFSQVKTKFPGSTAAQLSSVYLQQLQASTKT